MRRHVCVWFPDWPLQRLGRSRAGSARPLPAAVSAGDARDKAGSYRTEPSVTPPFVLTENGPAGLRVVAANAAAQDQGVEPGQRFADARARAPDLMAEPVDRDADARALKALALWMERWSPSLAIWGDDSLLVDITGGAHLFGGETAMLADIAGSLARGGLTARLGLAPTPGAAWALAHEGADRTCLDTPDLHDGLRGLAMAGLRLTDETLTLLRRFGLTRIGQLYDIDRKALARRFSSRQAAEAVLIRLDQALGRRTEPLDPIRPAPDHSVRLPCLEPLLHLDGVRAGLERLAPALSERLNQHGEGGRSFRLAAFRVDQSVAQLTVGAARPVFDPAHILRLFRDRLEQVDPGFGIELLELEAARTGPVTVVARGFGADFEGEAPDLAAISMLADRITARLGDRVVRILKPVASHLPERAEALSLYDGDLPDWRGAIPAGQAPRPIRLFERPETLEVIAEVPDGPPMRFVWRRIIHQVRRADGPERIAPEWWRPPPRPSRARDYYRVEDMQGRRYWIFREGLYGDGRGGPPAWYVHGLFA
ncbi:Y-family DNA polymerase [Maricaulis maris]|uniref:Y-family DNA polymerase n=1 Tax=Maricaulis maris TaxID=74318 RepID=UPI000EAF4C36|nr:DNA polymerase Y family protein [Maricaulis maris]